MSDLCRAAMIDDGRRGARLAADDRFAEYATPERVFGLIEQLEAVRSGQVALFAENMKLKDTLERIRDWRGFRHTGEARDAAGAALLNPATSRIGATTYQWLIERGQPESVSPTVWLENSAEHPPTHRAWTTNARQTAMFPDRETAERYIAEEGLDARAVEHGFMSAPDPAKAPDA